MIHIAFQFRFQKLLDVRESIERQRMLELAAALARQEQAQRQLEYWQTLLVRSEQRLRELYQQQTVPTLAVRREHVHRNGLHEGLVEAQDALNTAAEQVAHARSSLLEATKERKVMERLRERHEAEYRRTQDRREQAELDEIASRAAGHERAVGLALSGKGEAVVG